MIQGRRVVLKGRALSTRMTFRGLPISVETSPGEAREWADDATGERGRTIMGLPYGYVRGTLGLDDEAVDVFVGPDETAPTVFIITQLKAPEFTARDEEKVLLGFARLEDAADAYQQHYDDPRFLGAITPLPFATFVERLRQRRGRPLVRSEGWA